MLFKTLIASLLVLLLSTSAIAAPINYEATFGSIDTSYQFATQQLEFVQNDVVMIIEGPGQTQQAIEHLDFLLRATLTSATTSAGGRAEATFSLDLVSIINPSDPGNPLLIANNGVLHVEESSAPMISVLTYTGQFWEIANWGLDAYGWDNPGIGTIFALSWEVGNTIDDFFTENYEAESSVTLIPEPITAVLLLAGGPALLLRRRKVTVR